MEGAVRQDRLASACSSMSASPITRPISARSTGCCGRAGSICTTPSRAAPRRPTKAFRQDAGRNIAALIRYIFPGGELDHLGMSIANLERYGFEVHDVEGWREHYQRTTRLWCDGCCANRDAGRGRGRAGEDPDVAALSRRLLARLRARRRRRSTRRWRRSARKGPSGLPPTRADLYRVQIVGWSGLGGPPAVRADELPCTGVIP